MNMRLKFRLKLRIIPRVGDSRKAVCVRFKSEDS
jgi:hypothetical protein